MIELWHVSRKHSYLVGTYENEDDYFVIAGLCAIGFSHYEDGKYYKNARQKSEYYVIINVVEDRVSRFPLKEIVVET